MLTRTLAVVALFQLAAFAWSPMTSAAAEGRPTRATSQPSTSGQVKSANQLVARPTPPVEAKPAVRPASHVEMTTTMASESVLESPVFMEESPMPMGYQTCQTNTCQAHWVAGFEATFLKPHFSSNPAYTLMESDGTSFENFTDVEFDYDLQFAPRVYLGLQGEEIGLRATWWHFENDPSVLTAQPPANGFGSITPPTFGTIDISTTVPGSSFQAGTGLTAYTIDLDVTRQYRLSCWQIGAFGGLRYAEIDQKYLAQTTNASGLLTGQIDYQHGLSGIGPTMGLYASVPVANCIELFSEARGSILFGKATSQLTAGEDLDLTTPFTTTTSSSRDEVMTIGEVELGLRWQGCRRRCWQPFGTVALEGQTWGDAGNATSEDGSVGFFGFNASLGFKL
ncbi:Lpg1974 family pore-forming outer membrane protein [Bremerella sp.]|uniref:Lpg1974 family pore-forming outer membrane protein n=1 Tax=Bremerella sp. TaxID=2795602 RepID=UPI00391B1BFD